MAYNRDHFFETVRAAHGSLKAPQVEGFNAILAGAETRKFDKRWTAYVIATAWWESARAMQPVPEVGRGKDEAYGKPDAETGQTYYGRGLVQLTWKTNYAKMAKLVGVDLVAHPDLALELGVAVNILFDGMQLGVFAGKRLVDYFTATTTDWTGARRIVNGTDHASDIAALATGFNAALVETASASVSAAAPTSSKPTKDTVSQTASSSPDKGKGSSSTSGRQDIAKPAPAPVAAAPAHPSATTKAATMDLTKIIPGLFGSMLGGIETKLKDTAGALQNGTASAAGAAAVATKAVGAAPNAIAAAEDIAKLAIEVETHDWADIPATLNDFMTKLAGILVKFDINTTILTEAQSILAKFVGPAPAVA